MLLLSGIVIGLLLAITLFLAHIYLSLKRGGYFFNKVIEKTEQKSRPQVKIFAPPSVEEEAQQELVEKGKREGRDILAEDLGI